jgi:hypothetical protein
MTYFESASGVLISFERALTEVAKHGACTREFLADCGTHDTYDAQTVLTWLGY